MEPRRRSPSPEASFATPVLHQFRPEIEREMEAEQARPTRLTSLALMRQQRAEAERQAALRLEEQLYQQKQEREQLRQQQMLVMLQEEAQRVFGEQVEEILPIRREEDELYVLEQQLPSPARRIRTRAIPRSRAPSPRMRFRHILHRPQV